LPSPAAGQGPCSFDFRYDANSTPIIDEDVCNFHQVDADLYRGGRPHPNAYRKLVEVGIRTIIDLESPESVRGEQEAIQGFNQTLQTERRPIWHTFILGPTGATTIHAGHTLRSLAEWDSRCWVQGAGCQSKRARQAMV
jgi:hypothetical protein